MKNIKKPTYALEKGSGFFSGALPTYYVCIKCGKKTSHGGGYPPPNYEGNCPVTNQDHVWQQC